MLALKIDNPTIEKSLKSEFHSTKEITNYLYDLIVEDLEDKRIAKILKVSNVKEYVSKKEVFDILDNI